MSDTQSVLDMMTSGIMQRKETKAATLTPVGTEKGGPLKGPVPADFPYDYPEQEVRNSVGSIRNQLRIIAEALDAVEKALAGEAPPATIEHVQGREYTKVETPAPEVAEANGPAQAEQPAPPDPGTWRCPNHGYLNLTQLTSRKGRTYWACTACKEFER